MNDKQRDDEQASALRDQQTTPLTDQQTTPPTDEQTRPDAADQATETLFGDLGRTKAGDARSETGYVPTTVMPEPEKNRRPAAFGTIFWGVILLVFASVMAVIALPGIVIDTLTLVIVALVGGGVLLVVAGIAASFRRN